MQLFIKKLDGTIILAIFGKINILESADNLVDRRVVSRIQAEEDDARPEECTVSHQEFLDDQILSVPSLNDENLQVNIGFVEVQHEQLQDDGDDKWGQLRSLFTLKQV